MSELSREQIEALARVLHEKVVTDSPGHGDWEACMATGPCMDDAEALTPTVAAMLAEARAEVVRGQVCIDPENEEQVQRLTGALALNGANANDRNYWRETQAALRSIARHASAAAGAPEVPPGVADSFCRECGAFTGQKHSPGCVSAAAGAPPEPSQASSGAEVHPESARPSDGRTGPRDGLTAPGRFLREVAAKGNEHVIPSSFVTHDRARDE